VLLLRHASSGTPMELSLGWLPFEREAMAHAEKVDLMGVSVPIARAEDLVIYKAVAWRERDRSDIERLLIAHRDQIDLQRVRRVVREFADALDEPARIVEFDGLIERAIGLSAR
jgi:predicted nucleotidyltransferase